MKESWQNMPENLFSAPRTDHCSADTQMPCRHHKQGNVLPGVSVFIKGTSMGVATNMDGYYTIEVPVMEGIELTYSFIGMKSKSVALNGRKNVDVVLEEEVNEMNEVIVTGYQKVERRKLTSSITTVKMEDLKTITQPNIDKLLQGQVPGMTIM